MERRPKIEHCHRCGSPYLVREADTRCRECGWRNGCDCAYCGSRLSAPALPNPTDRPQRRSA
jgi:hypothetical protein